MNSEPVVDGRNVGETVGDIVGAVGALEGNRDGIGNEGADEGMLVGDEEGCLLVGIGKLDG